MAARLDVGVLTDKQQSVRELLEWGWTTAEIVKELGLRSEDVSTVRIAINKKLGTEYTGQRRRRFDSSVISQVLGANQLGIRAVSLSQVGLPTRQIASVLGRHPSEVRVARLKAGQRLEGLLTPVEAEVFDLSQRGLSLSATARLMRRARPDIRWDATRVSIYLDRATQKHEALE